MLETFFLLKLVKLFKGRLRVKSGKDRALKLFCAKYPGYYLQHRKSYYSVLGLEYSI
jgi:hypothetical protein